MKFIKGLNDVLILHFLDRVTGLRLVAAKLNRSFGDLQTSAQVARVHTDFASDELQTPSLEN